MMDDVNELEQVVLTDDEGNEAVCLVLARLQVDGQEYVVVVDEEEPEEVENEEAGTAGILRVQTDEEGEENWITIDDDDEWERVAQTWALLVGADDDEDE